MEIKAPKRQPMTRINTRVEPHQHKFIKSEAKRLNITEGEVFRSILQKHINNKKN